LDKHLHIISLETPYPVSHGGLVDLYFKLAVLHSKGIFIHLHCFTKTKGEIPELELLCKTVSYYPRRLGYKGFSFRLPYIVSSRLNESLFNRLSEDDYPVLAEGIHSTGLLTDKRFKKRKVILRLHNIEFKYYYSLYKSSHSIFKKLYFWIESRALRKYERLMAGKFSHILALSESDIEAYRQEFGVTNISYLPVFTGFSEVEAKEGVGCYCLYQGNLSVAENEKAAIWLLREVFNKVNTPFIIAGKDPSSRLLRTVSRASHATLMANPSVKDMQDLISKAQINILPSFNNTGVKLKLLNALFNGRHCIVNAEAVAGSGLAPACHIAGNASGFQSIILQLYNRPFEEEEILLRKQLLGKTYTNEINAQRLIQWIW